MKMPSWLWKNEKGEEVEGDSPVIPPDKKHQWKRVYRFGVGQVPGAGGSPARGS